MMTTNDTFSIEDYNSQYTFWKLLNEYIIEIPIIQRDYVQGRDSAKSIRKELLESIYFAFINENSLDFDFVYGSSEDCEDINGYKSRKLLPLDGQQRLTTLFLLHWYLAEKEGRMETVRDVLCHFSYTTRVSSREFCKMIVGLDYTPVQGEKVSKYIKNENRYFKTWDTDPTIKAMLTMLDDIHDKFFDCEPLFDKLISDSPALITFNYLPLEQYALTDDLYIKMNARGKPLSVFENFKAKFIQHMKKNGFPYEHFEANIDGQWVNLLWDYHSDDYTIDMQFMNLFCYCTEMIFLWMEEPRECESPFRYSDIRKLVEYYDSEEKVNLFYSLMDLWTSKNEAKEYLESILSEERISGKVRLFDGQTDIFSVVVLGNNVTVINKILLFSIMNRLIMLGKDTDKDKMLDYVRISRNLLIKNRFFSSSRCAFTPDFRFGRNGIPYTSYIANYLADSDDPYQVISGEYLEEYEGVNSEIYRQESIKANMIISRPELKGLLQGLEDLSVFRGSIFNILDYAIEYEDETIITDIENLFVKDNSDDIIPAILSVGDYGIKVGGTFLGDKYFYGNKAHWYEILSYQGGVKFRKIIIDFIRQYQENKSEIISDALHEIAAENLKNIDISDWRYCLIKYPSTIKNTTEITYSNLVFAFEGDSGISRLHRMNGRTLNALHVVPEYIEAALQLEGICLISIAGQNSDDTGKVILTGIPNGPVAVELNKNGILALSGYTDSNEALVDETIEQYNNKDTEGLDRVERLVLLANTAIEVFSHTE